MNVQTQKIRITHTLQGWQSALQRRVKYVLESLFRCGFRMTGQLDANPDFSSLKTLGIPFQHGLGDALILFPFVNWLHSTHPHIHLYLFTSVRTDGLVRACFPNLTVLQISRRLHMAARLDVLVSPSRNLDHYRLALRLKPKKLYGYNMTMRINHGESHHTRAKRLTGLDHPRPWQPAHLPHGQNPLFINDDRSILDHAPVALVIGGRWKSKTYAVNHWQAIINKLLADESCRIVLLGLDIETGQALSTLSPLILDLTGKTAEVDQLVHVLRQCRLVIGVDGGIIHLAMASDVPTIALFSSVNPATVIPEDKLAQVIVQKKCPWQPCYNEEHEPFCPYKKPLCIDIDPVLIYKQVSERSKLKTRE